MKLALKIFLFLFAFVIFEEKSFSINNYKIKEICSKEKIESKCIKRIRQNRIKLQNGNPIEIPVIPYKR